MPGDVDEASVAGEAPVEYVARVAAAKAEAVVDRARGRIVLAADTTVVAAGRVFGKPGDDVEAAEMLRQLSGRSPG